MERRHSSVSSTTMVNDTFPDSPHPNHPPTTGASYGLPSSGQLFRPQPRATADPFPDTYQQQPGSPGTYKPDLFPSSSPDSLPGPSRSTLLQGGVQHMTTTFGPSASASSLPSDSLYFVIVPRQGSLSDVAPLAGSLPSPFGRPVIPPSSARRYQELLDNIAIPFDYCANLIPLPPSPKESSFDGEPFREMLPGSESTACKPVAGEAVITAERLSKIFDYADADVALRSSDRILFMCHRANLRVHSTVFTELLSKGPATNSREGLPGLDLAEDEEVLELMLQYLYPQPPPDLSNLGFRTSRRLYEALCKYKVYSALRTAEMNLRRFLSVNPYEIFVVGVRWDSRELTKRASTETLRYDITAQAAETMEQVPSHALNRLWSMHYNRLRVVLDTLRNSLPEDGHGETEVTKYPDVDIPTCHARMKEEWKGFRDANITPFVNMLEPEEFVDRFDRPECAGCRECLRLLTDSLRKAWDTVPNAY